MKRTIIVILLLALMISGCSGLNTNTPAEDMDSNEKGSLLDQPELNYEVPVSTPKIMVNQMGYLSADKKVAVFRGAELPEEFYLVDRKSNQIVYTGVVTQTGKHSGDQVKVGYGNFTEIIKEGEYYVEAPVLGQSYSFLIEKDLYDSIFMQACRQFYFNRCGITLTEEYAGDHMRSACHAGKAVLREDISVSLDVSGGWHRDQSGDRDVGEACLVAGNLLLSYELYEGAYGDHNGIPESGNGIPDILDEVKYETDWLLKMQNSRTGGVYSKITAYDKKSDKYPVAPSLYVEPESPEAAAAYSALLAKFSYIYQKYDTEYATACLKAADRAWKYMERMKKDMTEEALNIRFWAAAELYRASGYKTYHNAALEYLREKGYEDHLEDEVLLGCVTYINTKKKVNLDECDAIIKILMARAKEIVTKAKASAYLVCEDKGTIDHGKLLEQMQYLLVVNYVIPNIEYETVIQDHLHYFMGRNEKGISYVDGVGIVNYQDVDENLGVMKQMKLDSRFIFMLSRASGGQEGNDGP